VTALTLGSYPYVEDYLDVLLRHGRKPVTIIRYRYVLDRILREMEELGLPTNPHEISEDNIYEIFASIKVGDDSKSSYCTILKQWLRFHTNNAAESVRLMLNPPARENVRWVTDDDISLSISASLRPQDKVILHLGSAYGLRRGRADCRHNAHSGARKLRYYRRLYQNRRKKGRKSDGHAEQQKQPLYIGQGFLTIEIAMDRVYNGYSKLHF